MAVSYAMILKNMYVTAFYASIIPAGLIINCFGLYIHYWVEKVIVFHLHMSSTKLPELGRSSTTTIASYPWKWLSRWSWCCPSIAYFIDPLIFRSPISIGNMTSLTESRFLSMRSWESCSECSMLSFPCSGLTRSCSPWRKPQEKSCPSVTLKNSSSP